MNKNKWLIKSVLGIFFLGFGLCLFSEAGIAKTNNKRNWFVMGTVALSSIHIGIFSMFNAFEHKLMIDDDLKKLSNKGLVENKKDDNK
ncbi:MAG: hypothetical protein ACFBSE_25690 [Prochloraceae cyanobacterium]